MELTFVYVAIAMGLGCLVSVIATRRVIALSRYGWGLDQPDHHRKNHKSPVSRLGGAPIFLAFVVAVICLKLWNDRFFDNNWAALFTAALMFVVGFVDDLYPLGAKLKLGGQLSVAILAWSLGLGIDQLSSPFGEGSIGLSSPVTLLLTVVWLVSITNIINLIDGMDGLAGGICLLLCIVLGFVGASSGNIALALLSLALGGALIGFLIFNFPPAKIFMGDGGAYFLGFFIASQSLVSSQKGSIIAALLVVVVALGLPILDAAFAIIRRGVRGMPLFRADAEHIHHRLLALGFSTQTALFTMYAVCLVLAVIGLSVLWTQGQSLPIIAVGGGLFVLIMARSLGYVDSWKTFQNQASRAVRHRREVQFAIMIGNILEIEVERCQSAEEFWLVFWVHVKRLNLFQSADDIVALGRRVNRHVVPSPSGYSWIVYSPVTPLTGDASWKNVISIVERAYAQARMKWGVNPLEEEMNPTSHNIFVLRTA